MRGSNTERDQTSCSQHNSTINIEQSRKFNQQTTYRYELKGKKKKKRNARLPFCSQNEKRDLYAMVAGQQSWNKLDDVEDKQTE